MVDLANARFGGEVIWCSDEFFAPSERLVATTPPVWKEGEFTDHGKWMDGWETRRRREEGHDSCIVRLGLPGIIHSVTVDTAFFTGNFPESFSLEGCGVPGDRIDEAEWVELIARTDLAGDSQVTLAVDDNHRVTHLRLNIFPDGGVARLRVEGEPVPAVHQVCPDQGLIDLAVATLGGQGVAASDAHYSSPANLVSPTDPEGMWDGWETARRRGPGHDWAVVELGLPGAVTAVDVDTRFFKGNAPGWVTLDVAADEGDWHEAVGKTPVDPDSVNRIELSSPVDARQVRVNIFPDGGVARLRVIGRPFPAAATAIRLRYLNALFDQDAAAFFRTVCGSGRWYREMSDRRPFASFDQLVVSADEVFDRLGDADWRQAFGAHPRIGESHGQQAAEGEERSRREQSGVDPSDEALAAELASLNQEYEDRFGYAFIVRAAGRSGREMADLARGRIENDPGAELAVAAGQQREITKLRLAAMLCQGERMIR